MKLILKDFNVTKLGYINTILSFKELCAKFCILLTVHPGMIFVNNKLDAQFFVYIYFYSLHVSGSHVAIIRRIIVSMRHLVFVTLCR